MWAAMAKHERPMVVMVATLLEGYVRKLAPAKTAEQVQAILGELQGALDDMAHASKHWSQAEFTTVMHVESDIDPFNVAGKVPPAKTHAWLTKYAARWRAKADRLKKR